MSIFADLLLKFIFILWGRLIRFVPFFPLLVNKSFTVPSLSRLQEINTCHEKCEFGLEAVGSKSISWKFVKT